MTVHICRDILLGGTAGGLTSSYDSMWTVAVFLQGILGFTTHSTAGLLTPPAYQDRIVPYYSATQTGPNSWTFAEVSSSIVNRTTGSCFINLGVGKEMYVQFSTDVLNLSAAAYPVGYPDVSASFPVGSNFWNRRWLCLKSNEFPLANSGIFEVVSQSYSDNSLIIEYRAGTGSFPPVQTGSLATASFWEPPPGSDNLFYSRTNSGGGNIPLPITTLVGNGAGSTGYATSGSIATYPRMVLTSPHSSSWQVRLCIESNNDMWNQNDPVFNAIPGFGAEAGDFRVGKYATTSSLHLHYNTWHNAPGSALYFPNFTAGAGTRPGLDRWYNTFGLGLPRIWEPSETYRHRARLYMWGDDETGSCLVFLRAVSSFLENCFMMFGMPEDEPDPLPGTHPVHRLFAMGNTYYNAIRDIDWRNGEYNTYGIGGVAYSLNKRMGPIPCVMALLASIAYTPASYGSGSDRPIHFDLRMHSSSFAGGARELIPVELIAGGWDNPYVNGYPPLFPLEIRRLGHVPIARMGANVGQSDWATADDDRTWFHVKNGFYLPWGGIIPLP